MVPQGVTNRVAPDDFFFQIRPGLDLAGFGIANPGRMFFELWANVTQTAMKHKSKH